MSQADVCYTNSVQFSLLLLPSNVTNDPMYMKSFTWFCNKVSNAHLYCLPANKNILRKKISDMYVSSDIMGVTSLSLLMVEASETSL